MVRDIRTLSDRHREDRYNARCDPRPCAELDAVVVLDVDCHEGVIELVLVNLGPGVAHDVRVTFSDGLLGLGGARSLADLPLWSRVRTLRPGKEIRVLVDSTHRLVDDSECSRFTANVRWATGTGDRNATYDHDLEAYRGMPHLVTPAHDSERRP